MKSSKWLSIFLALLSCLAVAELVLIVRIYSRLDSNEKRISRMRDMLAELDYGVEKEVVPAESGAEASRLRQLEMQVQALRLTLQTLQTQDAPEGNLDKVVERKLGEKMMQAMGAFRGQMIEKRKLAILSKKLGMTKEQNRDVQDSIARVQKGILDIAAEANENDTAFVQGLERIMQADLSRKERIRHIRSHLATNTRPGTRESYLDAVIRLRKQAFQEISDTLTGEQLTKLKAMNILPPDLQQVD